MIAQIRQTRGQRDRLEALAVCKCPDTEILHLAVEGHILQRVVTAEAECAQGGQGFRQHQALEAVAAVEGIVADGRQLRREGDLGQAVAVEECIGCNGVEGLREGNARQTGAAVEGILTDAGHALGNGQGFQTGEGEGVVADGGNGLRDLDGFQCGALCKGAHVDDAHALRELDGGQALAVVEGVIVHAGNIVRDLHGQQAGVGECRCADGFQGRREADGFELRAQICKIGADIDKPLGEGDLLERLAGGGDIGAHVGHRARNGQLGEGIAVGECRFTDIGQGIGQRDGFEAGTHAEGAVVEVHDAAHAGDFLEAGAAVEGIRADLGHAVGDGDMLDIGLALEALGIDGLYREGQAGLFVGDLGGNDNVLDGVVVHRNDLHIAALYILVGKFTELVILMDIPRRLGCSIGRNGGVRCGKFDGRCSCAECHGQCKGAGSDSVFVHDDLPLFQ